MLSGDGDRLALGLSLAAAPAFAVMAALTGLFGDGVHEVLCYAASSAPALSGMATMYALMSAFHLVPWLKLISERLRNV